jgi:threonine/homoserine/homoserine lactone efflux protein
VIKQRLADFFPFAIAIALPLAGVILAINYAQQGQRDTAIRMGVATVCGCFLYALLFF